MLQIVPLFAPVFGISRASSCDMLSGFSVSDPKSQEPADWTDQSSLIMFAFTDKDTNTDTPCYWDAFTVPVNATAAVPGCQCDNPVAGFSYEKGVLAMKETLCI